MGTHHSKQPSADAQELALKTHFTAEEIGLLKDEFEAASDGNSTITKEQFKKVVGNFVLHTTSTSLFLERLFDAFDREHKNSVDFRDYIRGLSEFSKGTAEEKLACNPFTSTLPTDDGALVSFKLYDIDHDGLVSKQDLNRILSDLYSPLYSDENNLPINEVVNRIFEDLDVDDDGKLSYGEFQLAAMKEPEFDLLGRFLAPPPAESESIIFQASGGGGMSPPLSNNIRRPIARSPAASRVGSMIIRSRSPVTITMPTFEQVSSGGNNSAMSSPLVRSAVIIPLSSSPSEVDGNEELLPMAASPLPSQQSQ